MATQYTWRLPFEMVGNLIRDLATPLVATDAATKGYVDGLVALPRASILTWGNDSVAASVDTRVLAPGFDRTTADLSGSLPGGGNEGQYRAPTAGTIDRLRVRHNSNVGNGNNVVYTLRINGILSILTAPLASGAIGDASDLVNGHVVAAGDLIEMTASKTASIGAGGVSCMVAVRFTPA